MPDLLSPWIDQFNTASADTTTLLNNFFFAPGVALQQMFANQSSFLQQVLDDPSNINAVNVQIQENLNGVLSGFGLQNATSATTATVLDHTISADHSLLFTAIPGFLPADEAPILTPIIDFLGSPASGILWGDLGPFVSPLVELGNSITDGDSFNEILANTVGAFFNGADLNLDSLLSLINDSGFLPPGMSFTELDIAFGGLLSTGSVQAGPYEVFDSSGDVTASIPAVGGSIFNSVGLGATGVPVLGTLAADSHVIGPLGAWEGWAQTIAALLGWDGSASPLASVELPIIPADFFGDGASAAAADLSSLVQDFVSLF